MGLTIAHRGEPRQSHLPFLLIHGWCCNHLAMEPVAAAFPERPSLLVDLPALPNPSIPAFADTLLDAAPARFIAIGHSMGGQVALALAARAPHRVAGAVLLDPAHLLATDKVMATGEAMRQSLRRHEPAEVVRAFAGKQLIHPLEGEAAARFDALVDAMAATPAQVARAAWDAILAWNGDGGAAAALAGLEVPLLAISIDKPVNRLADLARASRHVMTAQVAGSGHMLQFEVMDQVAAMIRRWLALRGLEQEAAKG